jgi:hypothetical protein
MDMATDIERDIALMQDMDIIKCRKSPCGIPNRWNFGKSKLSAVNGNGE